MTISKNENSAAGTGREFMERTKYAFIGRSDQQKGIPQPPLELPPSPDYPVLQLPRPETLTVPPLDLRAAIEQRRSIRSYLSRRARKSVMTRTVLTSSQP